MDDSTTNTAPDAAQGAEWLTKIADKLEREAGGSPGPVSTVMRGVAQDCRKMAADIDQASDYAERRPDGVTKDRRADHCGDLRAVAECLAGGIGDASTRDAAAAMVTQMLRRLGDDANVERLDASGSSVVADGLIRRDGTAATPEAVDQEFIEDITEAGGTLRAIGLYGLAGSVAEVALALGRRNPWHQRDLLAAADALGGRGHDGLADVLREAARRLTEQKYRGRECESMSSSNSAAADWYEAAASACAGAARLERPWCSFMGRGRRELAAQALTTANLAARLENVDEAIRAELLADGLNPDEATEKAREIFRRTPADHCALRGLDPGDLPEVKP